MIIACGSNDGTIFTKEHFGDTKCFLLYEVTHNHINFIKSVKNNVHDAFEDDYGHQNKGLVIAEMLRKEHVKCVVNLAFGKNITIIAKKLIPIITTQLSIQKTLNWIQENLYKISNSEYKTYYKLTSEKEVVPYSIK